MITQEKETINQEKVILHCSSPFIEKYTCIVLHESLQSLSVRNYFAFELLPMHHPN